MGDDGIVENILEVENLLFRYTKDIVINRISFSVKRGKVIGILGPNGSGKTTLLRAIGGFLPHIEGSIFYNGKDIFSITVKERAKEIAFIPQFVSVPFNFNVEEIVLMGRYPHKSRFEALNNEDRTALENALRYTELVHKRKQNINSLSGGEVQRVFLAQVISQKARLLLLDEPISHLDLGHKVKFLNLISRMSKEDKITSLIVLHDINLAALYCDEILMLDKGRIIDKGIPARVINKGNIESLYKTKVFVKKHPLFDKPQIFFMPEK